MFEEIKDYQGRDLNTAFFPEKERNIGGHDVVLS